MSKKVNLLIDGDHLCHRHLYQPGLRTLQNSKGVPTGLSMGVLDQLNTLFYSTVEPIQSIYFVMGGGSCKWRREIYPEYKFKDEESRQKFKEVQSGEQFSSSDILNASRKILKETLPALGVKYIEYPNYEADEIAYFFGYRLKQINREVLAISDDFDWIQLCDHIDCTVYRAIKDEYVSKNSFKTQFGFPLEGINLYQALIGGHDNIKKPLNGFGEKSIIKMLNELDEFNPKGIIKWAEKQKPGSKKSELKEESVQKQLHQNIKLVDYREAPLTPEIKEFVDNHIKNKEKANPDKIDSLLKKNEFRSLYKNLNLKYFMELR